MRAGLTATCLAKPKQVHTQLAGFTPGFESLSYSVGMRAQHTTLNPKPIGTEGDFENRFWSFMSSANIAYEINEGHNLSVNFTSKTNSPEYDRLNPFVTYYSPTSISYGNPYLKPKRVNSWELSHDKSWDGDKMYLSNSLYYKKVNDGDIRYQFEDDEEIINYTYTNIDGAGSMGWEMIANYKPMEQFKIRTSFNVSNSAYVTYHNTQEEVSRRGTNFTSKSSIEYQMEKGFAAQVWMDYFSRQLNTQGQNEAYYSATVVLRQKFLDKKLNVSFMMTDVLNSWERNSSVDQSDTFFSVNTYDRNSQRYYLTVAYYFSKLKWSTDA